MNKLIKNISILIAIIVILIILQTILNFIGISVSSYITYIMWFVVVGIFYVVLPKNYTLFARSDAHSQV